MSAQMPRCPTRPNDLLPRVTRSRSHPAATLCQSVGLSLCHSLWAAFYLQGPVRLGSNDKRGAGSWKPGPRALPGNPEAGKLGSRPLALQTQ